MIYVGIFTYYSWGSFSLCFLSKTEIIQFIIYINNMDQMEQCFVDQELQQSIKSVETSNAAIHHPYIQHIPANQLRSLTRPKHLAARTLFLDRPLYSLPSPLNLPYQQQTYPSIDGKLKLKIVNSKNLSMQEYFNKKRFKCLYNKLESYQSDKKSYIGKLRGIDELIDYNQKCFKQLQSPQQPVNDRMQDKIDSDFESGNICLAFINQEEDKDFYLMIQNDLNTYGYNNWFFYRFRNKEKGIKRFSIVNMIKKTSFFSQGMLISIFSMKRWQKAGEGWFKGGAKVTFSQINFQRDHHYNDYYSCLSFEYDFEYDNDEVFFAINQPYTYTRLTNFIKELQSTSAQSNNQAGFPIEIKTIGYSISNNIIPAIRYSNSNNKNKEIIFIVARQHPCQTVGSFIAQNIIKQLNHHQNPIINFLLKNFQIIIVPMANPDGVIHGMSRCNMAGLDINRQWGQDIIKELNPQTTKIKAFINNISNHKRIKYMIDLHGHGKKLNSFFFSCKGDQKENYKLFSMSMRKLESRFNMYGCTYGVSKDKENTIRAKANNMGILHSYTLETSLYGWKNQNNEIKHFKEEDYNEIAKNLLNSIFLIEAKPLQTEKHLKLSKEQLISELQTIYDFIEKDDEIDLTNNDILSQSDPEGDQLDIKELMNNCEHKGIKKKLQENLKYQKKKKSKKVRSESGIFSTKNIRDPQQINTEINNKIATSLLTSYKETKVQPSQSKRISLTQKWKQKRQKIVQMRKKQQIHKQIFQIPNIVKFNSIRSKTKTQISINNDRKNATIGHSTSKKLYQKKKIYSVKMKTEFEQVQAINQTHTHTTSQLSNEQSNKKSALQIKFNELKQESLNILLTDTFSIHKINPNDRQKKNQHISSQLHILNQKKSSHKSKVHLITQPYWQAHAKRKEQSESSDNGFRQYKRFKKFIHAGSSTKTMQKSNNSVFYYFPIL